MQADSPCQCGAHDPVAPGEVTSQPLGSRPEALSGPQDALADGLREEGIFFAKGHGTGNDFVIIPDPDARLSLSQENIVALCDRRRGIGADGVLRVVRSGALLDAGEIASLPDGVERTDWFMDYRNADGTVAEMCGNGLRVFAHWLAMYQRREEGDNTPESFSGGTIGTRAGAREVLVIRATPREAQVRIDMGPAQVRGVSTAKMGELSFAGLGISTGNPHLAAVIPGLSAQDLADLTLEAPTIDPEFFPEGVNVEIVTPLSDGAVDMRVWERGVGETLSCGTGTVAAATAALADAAEETGSVTVRVPGGEVVVDVLATTTTLTGPSRIVATGRLSI